MPKKKENIETIDEVKRQIIDTSLVVAAAIGTLAYLVSLSRFFRYGFHISFIINFFILAGLITITLYRARLSIVLKTYVTISLVILLSLSDAFNYGLLSAARIYLILIPLFTIIYLSFIRTLIVYGITILCFLIIGYLHHEKILTIPVDYIPQLYVSEMYPWIITAVHISAVSIIILLVTRKFINTYNNFISGLELLVKERTEDLETTNEELTATNEELVGQREELETAINSLHSTQKQLIQSEKWHHWAYWPPAWPMKSIIR